MYLTPARKKRGAIELSIGTIVIIVLAVSMLILGVILIRTIFTSGIDSVKQIDTGVKSAINDLFSKDEEKKLAVFPDSRIIKLEQGSVGEGFALSIRNTNTGGQASNFGYQISLVTSPQDLRSKCDTDSDPITGWARIDAGLTDENIVLSPGEAMEDPNHVRFSISSNAPLCLFTVKVTVYENNRNKIYVQKNVDVQITSK